MLLVVYVAYAARSQRSIGIKDWRVNLPSGRSTLIQVGIAVADLGCSSLAMWSLMPAASNGATGVDGFFTVAVAFISATLLGFASHAPGSLGVFDAAMLLALPQIGKEELVAGLLLFRALYFMVPFAVALLTMGFWEASHMFRRGSSQSNFGLDVARMSEATSGISLASYDVAPDIAEPVIGPAGGGTRWLIRATCNPHSLPLTPLTSFDGARYQRAATPCRRGSFLINQGQRD